jgi:UDP-N-acetylglucosamine--N-acetylmuramyl-(pentapeptide) pyrophosphoryl-undecaprenol N-acetylglucosamine transferase
VPPADVVVGFGGYVALPAYLAARRLRVPIVVHEANARPGLANRIGARMTRHVAVASPAVRLPHAEYVGIPLRRSVATLNRPALQADARAGFGLRPGRPTLLVFGGSQGARRINVAVSDAAAAPRPPASRSCMPGRGNEDRTGPTVMCRTSSSPPERMERAYAGTTWRCAAPVPSPVRNWPRSGCQPHVLPRTETGSRPERDARGRRGRGLMVDDEALTADW